jgi:F-type H+-transporting ATPase subunit b
MRLDWTTLALQLVNFAILVWLLQRFLYRPVLRVIDARRAALAGEQAQAAHAIEAARQQLSQLQAQRAGLDAERAAALARAEEEGRKLLEVRRAQAQRDADGLLAEARRTLAEERQQAREQLQRAALDLAAEMARRVLMEMPEGLRVEAWLERIEAHLQSLTAAQRTELAGELTGGGPLRVVTAAPIAGPAQEDWRRKLRGALAPDARVEFTADPDLVAGAELQFPHSQLSFSARGAIAALQQEVQRHANDR